MYKATRAMKAFLTLGAVNHAMSHLQVGNWWNTVECRRIGDSSSSMHVLDCCCQGVVQVISMGLQNTMHCIRKANVLKSDETVKQVD
jgi:hypothetical protein